jgi:hypothetical protein
MRHSDTLCCRRYEFHARSGVTGHGLRLVINGIDEADAVVSVDKYELVESGIAKSLGFRTSGL